MQRNENGRSQEGASDQKITYINAVRLYIHGEMDSDTFDGYTPDPQPSASQLISSQVLFRSRDIKNRFRETIDSARTFIMSPFGERADSIFSAETANVDPSSE